MSEWWTYGVSDFLMFSAPAYYRLFELYNAALWPGHLLAFGVGAALLVLAIRGQAAAAFALLAACWFWVAWAFQLQRYATINLAASGFAVAFGIEGALLLLCAGREILRRPRARPARTARVGAGLLIFAIAGQPWLGLVFGRPLVQAEVFGLAPDPTALGTLGLLLLLQRQTEGAAGAKSVHALALLLWPIPLLWCLVSGATLWAMHALDAALMPCAAALAVVAALRARR